VNSKRRKLETWGKRDDKGKVGSIKSKKKRTRAKRELNWKKIMTGVGERKTKGWGGNKGRIRITNIAVNY